jgi:hypothetical protein
MLSKLFIASSLHLMVVTIAAATEPNYTLDVAALLVPTYDQAITRSGVVGGVGSTVYGAAADSLPRHPLRVTIEQVIRSTYKPAEILTFSVLLENIGNDTIPLPWTRDWRLAQSIDEGGPYRACGIGQTHDSRFQAAIFSGGNALWGFMVEGYRAVVIARTVGAANCTYDDCAGRQEDPRGSEVDAPSRGRTEGTS